MSQTGPNSQNEKGSSSLAFKKKSVIFKYNKKHKKDMLETNTMEQFWKQRYNETDKERADYVTLAARMTGYFGGIAKFDNSVPKQTRTRMLQGLIDMWNDINSGSQLHQEWIKGWEKEIKEISK
jgi:hypothetical protein